MKDIHRNTDQRRKIYIRARRIKNKVRLWKQKLKQ